MATPLTIKVKIRPRALMALLTSDFHLCFAFAVNAVTDGQSSCLPIGAGQKYLLNTWDTASVRPDSGLPEGSFALYNDVAAAGVVYMDTGDAKPVPIYIDTVNPPKVTTIFTPVSKCMIWFDRGSPPSTMIDASTVEFSHVIDMTGTTQVDTTYQDDGQWMDD